MYNRRSVKASLLGVDGPFNLKLCAYERECAQPTSRVTVALVGKCRAEHWYFTSERVVNNSKTCLLRLLPQMTPAPLALRGTLVHCPALGIVEILQDHLLRISDSFLSFLLV